MTDREKLAEVLNNIDFESIELSLMEPNIFRCLSIERAEIRHSAFLAYLLSPNENHGLEGLILRKFLRDIFSDEKADRRDCFDADHIDFTTCEIYREWKNIDILIKLPEDVLVIENKVDSSDHSDQLKRYADIANSYYPNKRIHCVYLTPFGTEPNDQEAAQTYIQYSYIQIVDILSRIVQVHKERIPQKIFYMVSDYIKIVRLEITMNDQLNEMAQKLYKAHKEAFDFVFENRPDLSSIVYPFFEKILKEYGYVIGSKNKGCVRFTSKKLLDAIPRNGYGWPDKELFLFEIDYFWSNTIKAVIAPGDETIAEKILEKVKGCPSYRAPTGKKWRVFYIKKIEPGISEENDEEIEKRVREIVDSVRADIDTITSLLEQIDFKE